MKYISARTSRAPPAPEHDEARARHLRPRARDRTCPSCSAISQCGLTPSTARGSPHSRTTTLFSSPPSGTSASVMFGSSRRISPSSPSTPRELVLERAISSPSARACAIRSSASLLRFLAPRDFLRAGVARRLLLFGRLNQRATLALERLARDRCAGRARRAGRAGASPSRNALEIVAQHLEVVHGQSFGMPSSEREKAAVRIVAHAIPDRARRVRRRRIVVEHAVDHDLRIEKEPVLDRLRRALRSTATARSARRPP